MFMRHFDVAAFQVAVFRAGTRGVKSGVGALIPGREKSG